MNIKKILLGTAVSVVMFGALAVTAFAAPEGKNLNASQCNTNGSPVVNVTYKVTNDSDSGVFGNWAIDNYNKKVQVWDQRDGNFCAIVEYDGQFVTTGPKSPQAGVDLDAGIKGTLHGGYNASFDGKLNPGANQINGNLGSFDQGNGGFDWIGAYFPGYTNFDQPYWSWTYRAGKNGTWINALAGNSGDITGNQ